MKAIDLDWKVEGIADGKKPYVDVTVSEEDEQRIDIFADGVHIGAIKPDEVGTYTTYDNYASIMDKTGSDKAKYEELFNEFANTPLTERF